MGISYVLRRFGLTGLVTAGLAGCGAPPTPVDPQVLREISFRQAFEDCCDTSGGIPQWLYDYLEVNSIWIAPATRETVLRDAFLVHNEEAQAYVLGHLQPMDIVLIRNHSRLSGRTSAGWFGHSAVYLGGEDDLRRLGVWDHPLVVPHHADIRAGKHAIESVGSEVSLAGPHLFEADSMAVFRPDGFSRARKRQIVLDFFAQIGAPFDHHFRMDNGPALYCTELINTVMPDLNLPVEDVKGHDIILPDKVAIGALTGDLPIDLVTYIEGSRQGFVVRDDYAMGARILESWPQDEDEAE